MTQAEQLELRLAAELGQMRIAALLARCGRLEAALRHVLGNLCEMVTPDHADGHPGQADCLLCQALVIVDAALEPQPGAAA